MTPFFDTNVSLWYTLRPQVRSLRAERQGIGREKGNMPCKSHHALRRLPDVLTPDGPVATDLRWRTQLPGPPAGSLGGHFRSYPRRLVLGNADARQSYRQPPGC